MNISVTEEQASLIAKALDFYSRVLAGQFNEITWQLRWRDRHNDSADYMINEAKKLLFPDGELSIHVAPDSVKLAYDIYKQLMHAIAPHAPVHNYQHIPLTGQTIGISMETSMETSK